MYRPPASFVRLAMKRTLPALLLVLILAAGGAAVYYAQKSGRGGAAAMAAVGYLPQDTLLLLAFPDPGQTANNWRTTDLYKIWSEPDVQSFLALPRSKIPPDKDRDDLLAQAARLQPKNLFIALTALDEKSNQPRLVAGFQFKGPSGDVDRLLAPLKDGFRQRFPAGKADLINYQGHSLETFDAGDGTTAIASAYLGDWYLVANDVPLLQATIDRFEHRNAAPSLEKDGDFQAVSAKLPAGYETLIFAHVQPFMSRIFALAAASGQPVNEESKAEAEKGRALGATTKIENGKIRDTIYYLAPGLALKDVAPLKMGSLALTSPDTLLYGASVFHIPDNIDLPDTGADSPLPNPAAILKAIGQQLQAKGLTAAAARAAFSPAEASFQLDWPANHAQPTAVWSVDVKDAAAAAKFVDALTSIPVGMATWEIQHAGALTLHVLTLPSIDAFRPTLAVTGKNVIIGLNVTSVQDAAAREQSAAPNFTQSETYKTAVAEVGKPNMAFSYLDTRTLFERVYGVAKPAALLGAAFLYPQVNDYADLSKLPPAEAISRHLSPTVMSASLDGQGELIESVGSVTLFQAGAVLVGGSAAAAAPFLQSRFGGLLPHAGGASPMPPAAVPSAIISPAAASPPPGP
jgi:hypothetical protein